MSLASTVSKCSCLNCGTHLEFPVELAGTSITCPNCQATTLLSVPEIAAPAESSSHEPAELNRTTGALSLETLLAAFQGKVRPKPVGFFYQIGLLLVTIAIVILPLLYVAMILFAAYGVFWWATHFSWMLGGSANARLFVGKFVLYVSPLFTGCVVVFFMIKPLLARMPQGAQPLALNPANEPVLFTFIAQICKIVGAPFPSRIDVDCELNASAGFRRGFKSLFGNDLVLTIGL
jgi:hypothetical protein